MAVDLSGLQTEGRNSNTTNIDKVTTIELCRLINDEDSKVAAAVEKCLPEVARAIDSLVSRVQKGGRVIYVGAGTSGRLGVLDASELPPTFTANPEKFIALISGGDNALRHAQEGAEDDVEAAVTDLKALKLDGEKDSLIGIAASGRTPYVLSCLAYARSLGCCTIGIACSYPSAMSKSGHVDHMVSAVAGPEVVTGSTRLKAGTATKLVLNMLSTGTMIKIGKTFGNIMIDVKATNAKLKERSRNILRVVCGDTCPVADRDLDDLLHRCDGSVKLAVATLLLRVSVPEARDRLVAAGGVLAEVLKLGQTGLDIKTAPGADGELMSDYVLCIDGGGSKCAAIIRDRHGRSWRGEGGPCNPTDVGIDKSVSSIWTAIQKAKEKCPYFRGRRSEAMPFAQIWVGLAGYDRPSISNAITSALEKMFSRPIDNTFRIMTDIELLVTAAASRTGSASVTALIAGTGSIAMRFSRAGDKFVRTGRSGGWGHILGDDGSGFDIGRQALRHCLSTLDQQRNNDRISASCDSDCLLCRRILNAFAPTHKLGQGCDLLTAVISSNGNFESGADTNVKKRIASAAPLVIALSDTDATARAIIDKACQDLVQLVQPLRASESLEPINAILVLAGGLMLSDIFQAKLKSRLTRSSSRNAMEFTEIICVPDPAAAGAEFLVD